jgi:hypothetical protein
VPFRADSIYIKAVIQLRMYDNWNAPAYLAWTGTLYVNGVAACQVRTCMVDNQHYNVTYRCGVNKAAILAAGGWWAGYGNDIKIKYLGWGMAPGGVRPALLPDNDAWNYMRVHA